MDFDKHGGWNKRGGWKIFMKSINVEGGSSFCGGWNFSKSVIVGPTIIREMRVLRARSTCYQKNIGAEFTHLYIPSLC